jgi:hypothetical protein
LPARAASTIAKHDAEDRPSPCPEALLATDATIDELIDRRLG